MSNSKMTSQTISTFYCVEIVCASPDYKRPYAYANVYHYLTIAEANEKRREEKREYYKRFLDSLDSEYYDTNSAYLKDDVKEKMEETEQTKEYDVDDFDEGKMQDLIYQESYMEQEPFSATLYQIDVKDNTITSKIIPFPNIQLDN